MFYNTTKKILLLLFCTLFLQFTFAITDTNWQSPWSAFDSNFKTQYQLFGENTLHWHDTRYYTQSQSDANWNKYTPINADINWNQLQNYSTGCPFGYVINDMNDTNFNCIKGAEIVDTNWQTDYDAFDANIRATLVSISRAQNFSFFDDFDGSITGQFWTAVSSGAGAGQTLIDSNFGDGTYGVIQFNKGNTGSSRTALTRGTGSILLGQGALTITMKIKVPILAGTIQGFNVEFGLHDASATNAIDGVYFVYYPKNSGDQNIDCVTASNGTLTTYHSNNIMDTNWHTYKILINESGTNANFYLDDTLICNNTTNIPTGAGRVTGPRMQILNDGGSGSEIFQVDYFSEVFNLTNPR